MQTQTQIEKISELIKSNSDNFIHNFKTLISLFENEIDHDSYTRFSEIFIIARKVITDSELLSHIGPYFLRFKKPVMNDDEEYMLKFDYESLIVDGCAESTAKLIKSLTENIKATYLKKDLELNARIKKTILAIVGNAERHFKLITFLE